MLAARLVGDVAEGIAIDLVYANVLRELPIDRLQYLWPHRGRTR